MKPLSLWQRSFPFRLAVAVSFIFATLVVTLSLGAFLIVSNGLMHALDEGLRPFVQTVAPQLADVEEEWEELQERLLRLDHGRGRDVTPDDLKEARRELALLTRQVSDVIQLQIVDARGTLLARSENLEENAIPLLPKMHGIEFATVPLIEADLAKPVKRWAPAGGLSAWLPPEGTVRAVYLPIDTEHGAMYYLIGAVSAESVRSVLLQLVQGLSFSLIITLILVGLVSAYFAWQAFRPIQAMTETAEAIDETSLETRIRAEVKDATLQRLVDVLNRMLERLQLAFQARRRFIDNASHELRTPLTALRAELDLALDRPRTAQEYQASIRHALEEVDHLIRLSEALLLLSKSGQSPYRETGLQLRTLVERVTERFEARGQAAGVSMGYELPGDLKVYGDPHSLESMLGNLIQNAIDACPHGGAVFIKGFAQARGGTQGVVIQVSDNGSGMPLEVRDKIFERFYQAKRDPGASHAGLGLAIVREIVAAHGGQIGVESEPDRGTCFTIWLPVSRSR